MSTGSRFMFLLLVNSQCTCGLSYSCYRHCSCLPISLYAKIQSYQNMTWIVLHGPLTTTSCSRSNNPIRVGLQKGSSHDLQFSESTS